MCIVLGTLAVGSQLYGITAVTATAGESDVELPLSSNGNFISGAAEIKVRPSINITSLLVSWHSTYIYTYSLPGKYNEYILDDKIFSNRVIILINVVRTHRKLLPPCVALNLYSSARQQKNSALQGLHVSTAAILVHRYLSLFEESGFASRFFKESQRLKYIHKQLLYG